MARLVHAVTAAAVVALTLAGCGGSEQAQESESTQSSASSSQPAAQPSTPAPAAGDDEQEIRELVQAQADAFSEGDWDALSELTCVQFREQAANPGQYLVPPISTFGTREQAASMDPVQLSDMLSQEFGSGALKPTVDRVAQAIVAYDEPGYQAAMLDVMTESATLTVDAVENITITGDTATADVTMTRVMGDDAPETRTDSTPFVREDGRWLDCTDITAVS